MKRFLSYSSVFILFFILLLIGLFLFPMPFAHAAKATPATTSETPTTDELISIENATVTLDHKTFTYTGQQIKPSITVKLNDKTLKKGTDYSITYSNNINVGTASIVIKGKGDYTGNTAPVNFTIKALSIKKGDFSSISEKQYNGKAITPAIKVTYNKATLKKDVDYTTSFKNNNAIGTASIIITGAGNYSGSITKSFKIIPKTITGLKASATTTSGFKLTWNTVSGVNKYQVYMYSSNQWKLKKTVSSNTFNVTGLTSGKVYKFKVRACKVTDSKTYKGDFSSVYATATRPVKTSLSDVTAVSATSTKVTWNKVSLCAGYEIQYSADSTFKTGIHIKTVNKASATSQKITGLKSGKTYYYRIRAFQTASKKQYNGAFSSKSTNTYSSVYAQYTTSYQASQTNRTTNLKVACKALNGKTIQPGETFNFDTAVGPRTKANGYKDAGVFMGGTIVQDVGGGICQVASTIYNAALLSNFRIDKRSQHSKQVSYVPLGRDAAIYSGVKNLCFTNTSKYTIKIKATVVNGKLNFQLLTREYAKPVKVTLKVTHSGSSYTLRRYANGTLNYTAYSYY